MHFTITASSSALYATWIFIDELGLLFDAGDGVSAALMQKSRKVKHVFITHADRDHVCGLLQFNQLNAREGVPAIYYPADCGSFPALREFMGKFDPQSGRATWVGIRSGTSIEIGADLSVLARASAHVKTEDSQCKALEYTVRRSVRHLRNEFKGLEGSEIARIREDRGLGAITEACFENLIGYSGDSPKLDPERWQGVRTLIHESTFLERGTAHGAHSNLPQVIRAAADLDLDALILMHFSTRYRSREIRDAIEAETRAVMPKFPVYALLPGEVIHDVLSGQPAWEP